MKKIAIAVVALLGAAGCGSSSASQDAADANDIIDCSTDPRVFDYKPGMSVPSQSGALDFILEESNPGPPAKGNDTWSLKVTNTSSVAQPGLAMTVTPFMPDHGHGTSVNATITDNHDGTYTVTPLYFFMPGVWRITFNTASPNDNAVFFFCVPG